MLRQELGEGAFRASVPLRWVQRPRSVRPRPVRRQQWRCDGCTLKLGHRAQRGNGLSGQSALGRSFQFSYADALAIAGPDLFVGNGSGVTEVDIQTGALVRIMSTGQDLSFTSAMVVVGPNLFVLGHGLGSGSLIEFDCSTGRLVRALTRATYRFSQPDAMALAGSALFVANAISSSGGSVTEINSSTGALVRVLTSTVPVRLASGVGGGWADLLVANQGVGRGAASVAEIDAATGVPVSVLSQTNYGFGAPQALVVTGRGRVRRQLRGLVGYRVPAELTAHRR